MSVPPRIAAEEIATSPLTRSVLDRQGSQRGGTPLVFIHGNVSSSVSGLR